tara:strand:+ start:145 stop:381 length:237 start_codon:yes stop_codon:yes gene_type:complete
MEKCSYTEVKQKIELAKIGLDRGMSILSAVDEVLVSCYDLIDSMDKSEIRLNDMVDGEEAESVPRLIKISEVKKNDQN